MTHRAEILRSIGVWTLLFSASVVSHADTVLFSNFGAGLSYNTSASNPVGNAFDGNLYAEGDSFRPSSSTQFSSLDIALSCLYASGRPDNFTISITGDIGDQPAMPLESFVVSGSSLGLLGASNAPLVLNSVAKPSLMVGTRYWVTVSSDMNDSIAWNLNSTGDTSDEANSSDGGATWFSPSGLTPGAFEVDGATTPVPELGSFALLLNGLTLLAVGRAASKSVSRRDVLYWKRGLGPSQRSR
jgi:hypothetical protein